jgi:UDP-N-acetylglucosamine diphosphorylase / glucose-1-phosphate thymidylyltransferase / UDP-N-acetylgalactosamine diphosphorylase / glucosamine-1-phosphate N-acetyltransferase / galactosamine-1-phosphate N-acetyltransferase
MQAVILAAGEGKRLRPLTDDIPKPMVRVGGKPILEYTLSILPNAITEVILVVGYRNEAIRNYFGNSFGGRRIRYVEQSEPKGTAHALLLAQPLLDEKSFLLLYGDDLYHPADIAACIQDVSRMRMLVKEHSNPERFGVCRIDGDGRVLEILEKQQNPPTKLINIGVYYLTKDIFSFPLTLSPLGEYFLTDQISAMAQKHPVYIERARFWHPIGYPEDVAKAEAWLKLPVEECLN